MKRFLWLCSTALSSVATCRDLTWAMAFNFGDPFVPTQTPQEAHDHFILNWLLRGNRP